MNKLTLLLCCIAATAGAGTIDFSGVVTDIRLDPEFAPFNTTKVGDTMTGHVDFNADLSRVTATVSVEGALDSWHLRIEPWTNSHFWSLSLEPFVLGYEAEWKDGYGYSGTDASFQIRDGNFLAYTIDGLAEPFQYGIASGKVTKVVFNSPDTGTTIALFGLGLGCIALFRRAK